MKPTHFHTSIAISAVCLALSLILFILGHSTRNQQGDLQKLQAQYQTQQEQISAGVTMSQQIGPNLLRDMASFADDAAMKAVLVKHGYNPETAPKQTNP